MKRPQIGFDHIMLRVKDPAYSLPFYQEVLGMTLIHQDDYPDAKFSLYFLGFGDASPNTAMIELTHNWGSENDEKFSYHHGNSEPQGYGHICLNVPDLAEAVAWFDHHNVVFIKRPEAGRMSHIAFIADPDGYRIEIIGQCHSQKYASLHHDDHC